ncbi:MAG: AbrB/MazE/SpoVT family DNA-binding domain-containing protein [Nanoarchaeota archaeon]|nr:AbrB/MazE/SpoVT family DNA-binding domain-containing protein [Nanoarchaeota archaeon]
MELKTKLRRFGNSFGIIVPAELARSSGLREGEDISVTIEESSLTTIRDMLEAARRQRLKFTKSTQEIMDEIDRELEPEMFED